MTKITRYGASGWVTEARKEEEELTEDLHDREALLSQPKVRKFQKGARPPLPRAAG